MGRLSCSPERAGPNHRLFGVRHAGDDEKAVQPRFVKVWLDPPAESEAEAEATAAAEEAEAEAEADMRTVDSAASLRNSTRPPSTRARNRAVSRACAPGYTPRLLGSRGLMNTRIINRIIIVI